MASPVRTARKPRGICADPKCGKPVEPGQRYYSALRYATSSERPTVHGGRIPIVMHEFCQHPGNAVRLAESRERDRQSLSAICQGGTVPGPGGRRVTCPVCEGKGCRYGG